VEQDLLRVVPPEYLYHAHHWLILHGRYICTARSPKCDTCPISDICLKNGIDPSTDGESGERFPR
jgi:endonuclease-3